MSHIKRIFEQNKILSLYCFFVLAVGIFLRVYALSAQSLWLDELVTYSISQQSLIEAFNVRASDFNSPLYDYILKIALWPIQTHNEITIRYISVIFGIAGFITLFIVAYKLLGIEVATITASMTAAAPTLIFYSQESRPYSLMILFAILFTFAAYRLATKTSLSIKDILFYSLSGLILCYSHYGGLIFGFWVGLAVTVFSLIQRRQVSRTLIAQLLIIVGYIPWLGVTLTHSRQIPDWLVGQIGSFPYELARFIRSGFSMNAFPSVVLFALLVTASCVLLLFHRRDFKSILKLLFAMLLAFMPFVLTFIWLSYDRRTIFERHLLASTFIFYVAVAYSLSQLVFKTRWAVLMVSTVLLGFSLWYTIVHLNFYTYPQKAQLREAAAILSSTKKATGKPIVVCDYLGLNGKNPIEFYSDRFDMHVDHKLLANFTPPEISSLANTLKQFDRFLFLDANLEICKTLKKEMQSTHEVTLVYRLHSLDIFEFVARK